MWEQSLSNHVVENTSLRRLTPGKTMDIFTTPCSRLDVIHVFIPDGIRRMLVPSY